MKRLIVSDVSGTVTDLEEGAAEFNRRFVQALTRVMQVCARDVASEVEEAMRFMDTTPHLNGWVVDGEVVAPATADPYVRAHGGGAGAGSAQPHAQPRGARPGWTASSRRRAGLRRLQGRRAPVPGLLGSARRAIHEQYGRGRGAELV